MSEFRKALEEKRQAAVNKTPPGMCFIGWILNGYLTFEPPTSVKAMAIYAFDTEQIPMSNLS